MSYTRKLSPLKFDYSIRNVALSRVTVIKDLGVKFDDRLIFVGHIQDIYKAAIRLLGFIMRNTLTFRDITAVLSLYYSFIRSKLEYCSVIWSPTCETHQNLIETVQKKF